MTKLKILSLFMQNRSLDWGRKRVVDFSAGKVQLHSIVQRTKVFDVRIDSLSLIKNLFLGCWNCRSLQNWIGFFII